MRLVVLLGDVRCQAAALLPWMVGQTFLLQQCQMSQFVVVHVMMMSAFLFVVLCQIAALCRSAT
jgi:hypothetical protein